MRHSFIVRVESLRSRGRARTRRSKRTFEELEREKERANLYRNYLVILHEQSNKI